MPEGAHQVVLPPLQMVLLPPVILHVGLGLTVTVKVHVDELPQPSVATLVTVVIPEENVLPDGGVETIVTELLQASDAVTMKLTTLLH
jgi:hypothetical protein